MEEYHRLRAGALSEYRGLPYDPGPRGADEPSSRGRSKPPGRAGLAVPARDGRSASRELGAVGPEPIPNGQTTTREDPVSGRVTAIAVDPLDANVAYVGTAQGGVYRTLDGGASWTAIFDAAAVPGHRRPRRGPFRSRHPLRRAPARPVSPATPSSGSASTASTTPGPRADLVGPDRPASHHRHRGHDRLHRARDQQDPRSPDGPGDDLREHQHGPRRRRRRDAWRATGAVPPQGLLGIYRSTNATSAAPSFQKMRVPAVGSLAPDTSGNSRVTDMVFAPGDPNLLVVGVYGGSTEGGIWRSQNALSAIPIFIQAADARSRNPRRVRRQPGGLDHDPSRRHRRVLHVHGLELLVELAVRGAPELHRPRRDLVRPPSRRCRVLRRPVLLRHRRRHGPGRRQPRLPRRRQQQRLLAGLRALRPTAEPPSPCRTSASTPTPTRSSWRRAIRASSTSATTAASGGRTTRPAPGPASTTRASTPRSSRAWPCTRWTASS